MNFKAFRELLIYIAHRSLRSCYQLPGLFLPVKMNRIVFDSFHGKQFSCNPRSIYEYLQEKYGEQMEYVWLFEEPEKFTFLTENANTKVCRYRSLRHYYYALTSGAVVFNFTQKVEVPSPKGQLRIQTWHGGGCYKTVAAAMAHTSRIHQWVTRKMAREITHFISSSRYFSEEVVRKQFLYSGRILECGMPRNAHFFDNEYIEKKNMQVRKEIGISKDDFVVLYAPTYRDEGISGIYENLDYSMLRKTLEEKYQKKVVILFRGHSLDDRKKQEGYDLDLSAYPDMQELLFAADLLLTDYSSSIWDYSFKGSPCALYTPDLEEYQDYRGFDRDIETWGYPICKTNEALRDCLLHYDIEDYQRKMKQHHHDLGSFESGKSTEKVCRLITKVTLKKTL